MNPFIPLDNGKYLNLQKYDKILIFLSEKDSYVSEISRETNQNLHTVFSKIEKLISVGLVKKLNDRGTQYISLTEKGREIVEEMKGLAV